MTDEKPKVVVMTLGELMALPPAERAVAVDLARKTRFPRAEGAWPPGTRVRKRNSHPGDSHPDRALGIVVGSIAGTPGARELIRQQSGREIGFYYLVLWQDLAVPVAVPDDKLEVVNER